MVTVVALTLTIAPWLDGSSWQERLDEARQGSACEVEVLLDQLEREREAAPDDMALARLAFDAAVVLLYADESELERMPSIRARYERAREAARRTRSPYGELSFAVEYDRVQWLLDEGRSREAQEVALAALDEFPRARGRLPEHYLLLGRAAFDLGDKAAARGALEECIGRIDEQRSIAAPAGRDDRDAERGEVRCEALSTLVGVLLDLGLVDAAAGRLDELIAGAVELGSDPALLQAQLAACRLALAIRDHAGQLARARQAAQHAADDRERRVCAVYELSALLERARDDRGALPAAERALEPLSDPDAAGRTPQSDLEVARVAYEIALLRRDPTAARSADERLAYALEAAGRESIEGDSIALQAAALRAAFVLEHGGDLSARVEAREELVRRYDAFLETHRRLPPTPGGVGHLHWGDRRRVISELVRLEIAIDDTQRGRERALEALLQAQSLGSFGRLVGASTPALAEVRAELLGPGTGLLLWLPALERSHLFAIDRERVDCWLLDSRDELLAAVKPFADLATSRPESSDLDARRTQELALGRALRDALLPEETRTRIEGWTGFYVSGLDLCGDPALETLPWTDGAQLGARFAVSRLPSVPAGIWLVRRAREGRAACGRPVVLASPRHGAAARSRWPNLEPIAMSRADRRSLANDDDALFLLDDRATIAALRSACAAVPALLEVFAHGVYALDSDRPAGLILAEGTNDPGVLGCAEIEAFEAMASTVALYVCGSARGPTRLGDDTSAQLANAFAAAGASSVLVARGDVVYGAALEVARSYREDVLKRGLPPAQALARARQRLAEHERWSDLYFRAPFAVHGIGIERLAVRNLVWDGVNVGANRRAVWVWAASAALLALLLLLVAARGARR